MKKIIICLLILLVCGCNNKDIVKEEKKEIKKDIQKEEVKEDYKDLNNTPVGLYSLNGNSLNRLTTINKKLVIEEDLGVFQVYFSNDDNINLNSSFADSYYEAWNNYKVKVGFNLKFHLVTGEDVSYNILKPDDCMARWEHFMNYLYDDYANKGKSFYSHIENNEYNESTLFTAIKIQSSYQVAEVDSKIELTVFTYDSEDDFDENLEYRGNSHYTMIICPEGISC